MKKLIGFLTIFGLMFSPFAVAEEPMPSIDEQDELFNRGTFVGNESDEYLRARRRERNKNWGIALGTTALGIAALVLVGQTHHK